MDKKIDTKYSVGQTVYEKFEDNILVWTVTQVSAKFVTNNDKDEKDRYNEYYRCERKEKVGLLKTKTVEGSFYGDREDIFATKEETLKYMDKVKDAEKVVNKEEGYLPIDSKGQYYTGSNYAPSYTLI